MGKPKQIPPQLRTWTIHHNGTGRALMQLELDVPASNRLTSMDSLYALEALIVEHLVERDRSWLRRFTSALVRRKPQPA